MTDDRNWGQRLCDEFFKDRDEISEPEAQTIIRRRIPQPLYRVMVSGTSQEIASMLEAGLLRWKNFRVRPAHPRKADGRSMGQVCTPTEPPRCPILCPRGRAKGAGRPSDAVGDADRPAPGRISRA